MTSNRVFSEQEATKIIQRAVELSEESATPKYKAGVTREELERIASEVGVTADALARAISEAGQSVPAKSPLGLSQEFERVVEGELDPDQYDLVIEGLKPIGNARHPSVAQVGRTLSMSAWTGIGHAKVDLTSRNGRTRVKVRSNAFVQFMMTLYPALLAGFAAAGAFGERGMGWVGAGVAAVALAIGSTLFGILTKKGHEKAELLADDLRTRIENTLAESEKSRPVEEADEKLVQRLGQGG
jgi:hypothetical protein